MKKASQTFSHISFKQKKRTIKDQPRNQGEYVYPWNRCAATITESYNAIVVEESEQEPTHSSSPDPTRSTVNTSTSIGLDVDIDTAPISSPRDETDENDAFLYTAETQSYILPEEEPAATTTSTHPAPATSRPQPDALDCARIWNPLIAFDLLDILISGS